MRVHDLPRRIVLATAFFGAMMLMFGIGSNLPDTPSPLAAHAAPVMSIRYAFINITGATTVILPTASQPLECVDASNASGPFMAQGCNMMFAVPEGQPNSVLTFRIVMAQLTPGNTAIYDPTLEHPVGGWTRRTGTGLQAPYQVLQQN